VGDKGRYYVASIERGSNQHLKGRTMKKNHMNANRASGRYWGYVLGMLVGILAGSVTVWAHWHCDYPYAKCIGRVDPGCCDSNCNNCYPKCCLVWDYEGVCNICSNHQNDGVGADCEVGAPHWGSVEAWVRGCNCINATDPKGEATEHCTCRGNCDEAVFMTKYCNC
jgi:hypothetical protein